MKKFPYIIFILFFVLLCLNIFYFARGVWFDESFTMLQSDKPWSGGGVNGQNIFSVADVHPPLYYVAVKAWKFIGNDSIQWVRFLSGLFGLGSLFILYLLLRNKFGKEKRFNLFFGMFGALYIFATTNLHYFTEARMYSMGIFFCLLSFYSLIGLSGNKGDAIRLRVTFFLSTVALPYIHYYAAFFVLGELIYTWFFFKDKDERRKMFVIWGASFFFMIPAVVYFFMQRARIAGMWFKNSGWFSLLSTFHYAWFHSNEGTVSNINTVFGLIFLVVAFAIVIWYLVKVKNLEEKKFSLFMFGFFLMPPFLGMLINTFIMPVYHHRFFLFTGWIFIFLVARGLYVMRDVKKLRLAYLIGVIIICGILVMNAISYFGTQSNELKDTADYLEDSYALSPCVDQETIIIVHESPWSMIPYVYYTDIENRFPCYENYVFSDIPEDAFTSAGGDVIPREKIINNKSKIFKLDSYYYLWHDGSLHSDNFSSVVLKETDGLNLTLEIKK